MEYLDHENVVLMRSFHILSLPLTYLPSPFLGFVISFQIAATEPPFKYFCNEPPTSVPQKH